jgi:hypothetical protein|tara:strand:+ start:216 stop:929 length:714 start_codon:yes stop_codon:yes gene_type:complete
MILKVKRREHGFAIMAKAALENAGLSFKARGIYAYLMTKPESWTVNMKDLQRGRDGREAVQSGLKELQAVGLAEYKILPGNGGEWILYEVPPGKRVLRSPGKPVTGKTGNRETRSHSKEGIVVSKKKKKEKEVDLSQMLNDQHQSLSTAAFLSAWALWEQHRKELGKQAYKPTGLAQCLTRLSEWGSGRAVAAIEHSIANSYAGIYEPNSSNSKSSHGKRNAGTLNADKASIYAGIG